MEQRYSGTVKWFSDEKGYGFIWSPQLQADIFVHYSGINGNGRKSLIKDEAVTFSLEKSARSNKDMAVEVDRA